MIGRVEARLRWMRRSMSRSEWLVKLLGLPVSQGTAADPGVVMIQIDGLPRAQLELAMKKGRLPFLKKLLKKQGYRLHTHYSGMPSSTPGVQAELFYGVRTMVPAFSFYDLQTDRVFKMFNSDDAFEIERRLEEKGTPLLTGGSAYSNIYTGGAAEPHFCGSTISPQRIFGSERWYALPAVFFLHIMSFIRTVGLLLVETGLSVVDVFRGVRSGESILKEMKFVLARLGICILGRELITIGVKMDVARGLPIVHCNLLGFDEQAHRRGPDSAFAHWTLKGIDQTVKNIWKAASKSARRDYDVFLFSDHGQERVLAYPKAMGQSVQEAVQAVFKADPTALQTNIHRAEAVAAQRVTQLQWRLFSKTAPRFKVVEQPVEKRSEVIMAAMGPTGFIYTPRHLEPDEEQRLARELVKTARIPMVLCKEGTDKARVYTARGEFVLPEQAEEALGYTKPYLEEMAEDIVHLVQHVMAGNFVINGWSAEEPWSFPWENGAHGGFGSQETEGFALLPSDAPLEGAHPKYLRPINLHEAAQRTLGRLGDHEHLTVNPANCADRETLRVMTYNVHSCRGMDGKLSAHRIARIIAKHNVDVVALQELDVGRQRTNQEDQAHEIARRLKMDHHFHPALAVEEEKYGDAILTCLPMKVVRADELPTLADKPHLEPRGAIWVELEFGGKSIQFINTHLGLRVKERAAQAEELITDKWIDGALDRGPVIFSGDLNAIPGGTVCQKLGSKLADAQDVFEPHVPRKTFFSRRPVSRIDHIFVSDEWEIVGIEVPRSELETVASDHLPLIVELRLK